MSFMLALTSDTINALFEVAGSMFLLLSVLKLHKDKQVKGVSWLHVGFFCVWGYWNLHYYPSLGQWYSTCAGVLMSAINTVWLIQLLYYSRKE